MKDRALIKIHVDGVTHSASRFRQETDCGVRLLSLDLDTIMRMWTDATNKDVDCMACIAGTGEP